jgi:hypothetical protein
MATVLKNTVLFGTLAPGVPTTLPHLLNISGRSVIPDHIESDNGSVTVVSADAQDVTVRNDGGSIVSASILCERWHSEDRALPPGVNNLSPQPFVPVGGGAGGFPTNITPQVGATFTREIYARTTGDDNNGDGSLANPYRTFVRAIQDVPLFIYNGQEYAVDITGISELLAPSFAGEFGYSFPQFYGQIRGSFDFAALPHLAITGALTIRATPTVVDTVTAADIVSDTADATTGLRTIVTTKAFVPGALKGALIEGPAGSFLAASIWDNTATDLRVVDTSALATPFNIVTPGADLAPDVGAGSAVGLIFDQMRVFCQITGVKIIGNGGFGPAIQHNDSIFMNSTLCEISSFSLNGETFGLNGCSIIRNGTEEIGHKGLILSQSRVFYLNCRFDDLSPRSPEGATQTFGAVYEACNQIGTGTGVSANDSLFGGQFSMGNVLIFDGVADGMAFRGGVRSFVEDTEVRDCAGDGVQVDGPGTLVVENVQGTGNGGIGVNILNGGTVRRTAATAVTGAGGDYKIGQNAATAGAGVGWAAFTGNENDLVPNASSQFCRMYT